MPIHLNYQGTTCKKCGAEFIAHKKNCQCPGCGQATEEFCDFAAQTIATMKDHKQLYGNYFPESWFSGSAADLVQGIIFELFDNLEAEKPEDVSVFIISQLAEVGWEDGREGLAGQTEQIALEVYEIYKNDPDFHGGNLKDRPLDPKLNSLNPEPPAFDN
ncbi:MAG: hypothetical protein MUD10_05275 [Candidatus Pacebacteria bacterium]|jgi:hypothetical protein|nr:hypothetical protein [Candidatus Paceibacterota bacterium]